MADDRESGHSQLPINIENVQRQNDQPQIVIPLSTQFAGSSLGRVISSIRPLVAQSNNNAFGSYARRFFPQHRSNLQNARIGRQSFPRFQDTQPLVSQIPLSNSATSSGNSPASSTPVIQSPNANSESTAVQNVVINIDLEPYMAPNESRDGNNLNLHRDQNSLPNVENNQLGRTLRIDRHNIEELIGTNQDLRISIMNIWQYLVFICIVLVKLLLDKITSIFVLLFLSFVFIMGDKIVRRKATYQNRGFKSIFAIILLMPFSIYLLYATYSKEHIFYSAIFLFPDFNLLTLGELLWIIYVTDLVLKITTVVLKALVVLIPHSLINQRTKADVYSLLERISQLYRSLATIQPWLSYFLDGYSGPRKIFGVFLSAFYMLCKGPELILRLKELRSIITKMIFTNGYGSNPSKSELEKAGHKCPICYDDFAYPVRLACTHIFCENCVETWFTKEKTCPMCRTNIMSEDPAYRDGSTTYLPQIY